MKIRRATTADVEAACGVLHRSIIECCVDDHHNDPKVLSVWLQNKTPENIASWFASSDNFSIVAVSGSTIVGVGLLTAKGELALCYLLPEIRFRGVGKSLLSAMELHAMQWGMTRLHLSSTGTAKAFYSRNDFKPNGEPETEFGIQAFPLVKQLSANNGFQATSSLTRRRP